MNYNAALLPSICTMDIFRGTAKITAISGAAYATYAGGVWSTNPRDVDKTSSFVRSTVFEPIAVSLTVAEVN